MNMLNMQFDQAELNSAPSYELLPKGNYIAQIVNSEIKENRNGGNRLSLQWEIVDGQYAVVSFSKTSTSTIQTQKLFALAVSKSHRFALPLVVTR